MLEAGVTHQSVDHLTIRVLTVSKVCVLCSVPTQLGFDTQMSETAQLKKFKKKEYEIRKHGVELHEKVRRNYLISCLVLISQSKCGRTNFEIKNLLLVWTRDRSPGRFD